MSIWFKTPTAEEGNAMQKDTLVDRLGIRVAHVGDDFIVGTMPVDKRTLQVNGILHGGASVALAETLGSYAANCCVDQDKFYCVGIDVNANHIRQARKRCRRTSSRSSSATASARRNVPSVASVMSFRRAT